MSLISIIQLLYYADVFFFFFHCIAYLFPSEINKRYVYAKFLGFF